LEKLGRKENVLGRGDFNTKNTRPDPQDISCTYGQSEGALAMTQVEAVIETAQTQKENSEELIPQEIVDAVFSKQCIVFLGAAANAPSPPDSDLKYEEDNAPPMGGALSENLSRHIGYLGTDRTNLQRVSLCAEFQTSKRWSASRLKLIDFIKKQVAAENISPSPILHMLAAMPFPIYITTNYDTLMESALFQATTLDDKQKTPIVRIYDPERDRPPDSVPLDPKERNPVVFKLHGDINTPKSIVVTEEDYLEFILKMTNNHAHPLPEQIRARMKSWPTLFIGYSLKDYNLRLLLRTLRWNVDPADYQPFFSVDRFPDDIIVSVFQVRGTLQVRFIETDVWKFVPKLYEICLGRRYV